MRGNALKKLPRSQHTTQRSPTLSYDLSAHPDPFFFPHKHTHTIFSHRANIETLVRANNRKDHHNLVAFCSFILANTHQLTHSWHKCCLVVDVGSRKASMCHSGLIWFLFTVCMGADGVPSSDTPMMTLKNTQGRGGTMKMIWQVIGWTSCQSHIPWMA